MNTQYRFNGKRRSARLRYWGITLKNFNERGPRHHGVHLFQKDRLAGLRGCDFEAAISKLTLFHFPILSSQDLERPGFADVPQESLPTAQAPPEIDHRGDYRMLVDPNVGTNHAHGINATIAGQVCVS